MLGMQKVIWKEGLYLQPQHFQQAERNYNYIINKRISSYIPHDYGFTSFKIDHDAIANGNLSLAGAQGIMPDGTVFDVPKYDNKPSARAFEGFFKHDQQFLDVFLAIPLVIENKSNVTDILNLRSDTPSLCRYKSHPVPVYDEVYGKQKKEVEIGEMNIEILFGDESRDDYTSMQIGRLVRNSTGGFALDDHFLPPLLQIGASPILIDKIRFLLELLISKISSLSSGRRQLPGGVAEFNETQGNVFHLLQTLNTYTGVLNQFYSVPNIHPFRIYELLLQFTGALCSFTSEFSILNLPPYEHTNIAHVIAMFDSIIRKILGGSVSVGCVTLLLEEVAPTKYLCRVTEQQLLTTGSFYLGVFADAQNRELVSGTLSRIKMCSRERLEIIIPSAMPGIPLMHILQPPRELPTKPGYVYFKMDQQNDYWEGIKTSGAIGVYFPHLFKNLKMEILIIKK
ncbi:MAG: type VI secretion system baseplate subunit TssK [Chitinivibrionales bacterium]|nr:type VI secretion system baseplate subunit TssK [Chitinivibrionales bacterium]